MLEGLVASILNKWLGKYVEDFDTEQFNFGIFKGEVKLNNLRLKPEALFELELPIEIKYGVVGEMSLSIPWNSLSNEAIAVSIEDVFIVVNPVGEEEFDAEKERKLLRATRKKILDDLEGEGFFGNDTLLRELLSALANNIQLFVKRLHLRYEDRSTGTACGLCVQGISKEITNSKWKPSKSPAGSGTAYQLARLEAMTIYCNTGLDESGFVCENWREDMAMGLQTFSVRGKGFDFLIKPFSAKMKVIVSRSSEVRVPKLLVDLVIQDAVVQLSRAQLLAIVSIVHLFRQITLRRDFLHFRTHAPVSGNASVWWKYSYKAVLQQRIHPYTWKQIKQHRENYRNYKELYKQVALNPGNTELRLDLGRAEDKLSLSSIVIAREHAKIEIKNEDPDRIEVISNEEKWWSLNTARSNGNSLKFQVRSDKPRRLWSQLSPMDQLKLDDLLGASSEAGPPEKAKKYIEHKVNVTLHHFTGSVFVRGNEIASVALTQFLGSFESRPAAQAFKVSARAESFTVEGASVEHGLVPILTVHNVAGNSSSNFLSIDFEKNPLTVEADYGITVNVEPTEFIYHEHAVSEFLSFFRGVRLGETSFKSKCTRLRDKFLRLKTLIDTRQLRIYVNMNVKAPHIVIAETGSLQKAGMVLVLDLGKWTLRSDLQPPLCLEEVTQMELEERLYDRLHISLDGFQLLFTDSGDEWRESLRLDDTDYHILSKVRGQIVLSSSIKPDYKLLPRTKLNITVASIKLILSDRRIVTLLDFVEGLPMPSANTISVAPVVALTEFANDVIQPEPNGKLLKVIKNSVVAAELARQRTPENQGDMIPSLGAADMEKMWASVDMSDEDVELWARTVDLPGFDDNVSPNNVITSLFRIVLGEIVLILNRSSDLVDKPYLMARASKFRLDAAFMVYGPAVQATLGGVQLIDKLHIGTSGEYLEIITTQSDMDFISILYRKVRSDCPDFKSHFHSVEQSLVLDIGLLSLTVHREAILTFTKYLQYLYHKVVHKETCLVVLPNLNKLKSLITRKESADPPIPPGAVKFSYSTHVSELRLKLCDAEFEFLEFKICGFESDCMFKANERMVLRAYLSSLSVDDLSEITLYPKLVSIEDDKVFEMKYVRHSPRLYGGLGESSKDDVKSDGSLKLTVERIHIVLLYKMLIDIQHFTEPLIPVGVFCQIAGLLRRSISLQLHQLRGWNARLHLALTLRLPVLLVPQKVSSPNLILLNLGDLSVENFFKELGTSAGDEAPPVIDNVLLKLESAFCSRGLMTLSGSLEVQEEILEPIYVRFDVKRFVGGTAAMARVSNPSRFRDIPIFDLSGNMEPVKVALGQKDLSTILSVWNDNVADGKFLETSWWWRAGSPMDIRTPTEAEDPLMRKLQAFLSHGDVCRKDTVARFAIDSVVIILYNDMDEVLSSPVRDLNHGLCKLTLWEATFGMEKKYDNSIEMKMALHSCLLEDIRSDPSVILKKVLQSHYRGEGKFDSTISVSTPPIVDVAFKQTQTGDRCVDILVEKTRTNLSVSFLVAIGKFVIESLPVERNEGGFVNHGYVGDAGQQPRITENIKIYRPPSSADSTSGCYSSGFSCTADEQSGLSVSLQCRKPEIMIFSTGERKTRAILFRCEVLADWSRYPGRDALVLSLASLQAISKSHPANVRSRQETAVVLHPCDVEIARNVKSIDDGMKVTVTVSPVDLRLSVVTVATVAEIFHELHTALSLDNCKSSASNNNNSVNELEDLWSPKKILTYCDADLCVAVSEPLLSEQQSFPVGKPAESLTFSLPKIRVVIEVEYGANKKPLFLSYSSFKLAAHDWSSLLNLRGELELQANYFNESIGVWEPFIEPCGDPGKPWELVFQVFQGKSFPISPQFGHKKEGGAHKAEKTVKEEVDRMEDSETSGDESDQGMTFLRRRNYDTANGYARQPAAFGYGESDSENEDGALEKLTSAVGHLFTGDSEGELSESGDSSASDMEEEPEEEVETEDETASARSTAQERAVFLKKHSDSVDSGLETEAVDRLATHVLIHARDRIELTLTPSALVALEELSAALSNEHTLNVRPASSSMIVVNSLGPGAVVTLLSKTDPNQTEKPIFTAKYDREDSVPSSPEGSDYAGTPSPVDSETDLEAFSGSLHSRNGSLSPVLQFPMESLPKLYDRLTEKRLLIQVPGFQDLKVVGPKASGNKLHALHPSRNQMRYHVVLATEYHFGVRRYLVRGPLQIRNETSYAMGIYYKKSIIEGIGETIVGETTNPFEDMVRLAVVGADETFDVPLFIAYHCKFHFLPAHVNNYKISESGLCWQDILTNSGLTKDFSCLSKHENDSTVFSIRACCEDSNSVHRQPRTLPNFLIRLVPPLAVHNLLPYAVEVKLPQIKYDIRIEAGDKTNIYFLNLSKPQRIFIEIPEYLGISWTGSLNLTPDVEDKVLNMATEQDTEGGNKQLALSIRVKRNPTANIFVHSPYWIINKTGLPLQLRGSTSDFIHEWTGEGPLLFCYRKQRRRSVRLRAFTSSWSSAFSLDTPGCSGLVICRDRERKRRYRILVKSHLSQVCPELTKIIAFLPNFIVTNDCRKHLRFMEDNERADLWIDLAPGQCTPFWPETDSMRMFVKFRDSKLISQHFPVTIGHVTVLRMDKGCGLTVEVSGGGDEPFSIRFRNYRTGDAPIRIDNQCEDLFLKFHQKELNQVALLSPYQSLLYTWDDPSKERILVWNVYNNKGKEFCVPLWKDGFGEERVSFHVVRSATTGSAETVASKLSAGFKKFNSKPEDSSSTSSDDSDEETQKPQLGKKTRRDKVVVYWASYLDNRQRVLLLTQDERIARRVRKTIDAERSHLELFVSINGVGMSLISNDNQGKPRELAYLSLSDSAARWEVMVAHRWKPLAIELAAWLEEKYKQGVSKTHIKDYIHIDFEKMEMTKPFFGELRRRHKPAVWIQYRRSKHMSLLHAQIHRVQIDNGIHDAEFPTVLHPVGTAFRQGCRPAVEMAFLKKYSPHCNDVYKFGKVIIQEHSVQLERSWLCEMYKLYSFWCRAESPPVRMRQDIALVHLPISGIASKSTTGNTNENMIEFLHCSPIKLQISFSPQNEYELKDTFHSTLATYFLSTFASSLTQIKSATVKLLYHEVIGQPCTRENLWEQIYKHYKSQLLQQLHVLVMGVDVLANPYSQFMDFADGSHPQFYEPNMASIGIPEEFSEGLSIGALGFLGHEIGGPAESATLLAASLGTALQRVIHHEDFSKKKLTRMDSTTEVPDAVVQSSSNFATACSLGLSGVVVKPNLGNGPLHGVETFFRGPGKGLMGLMSKSSCGVLNCLSMASYGVRRASEMGENIVMRLRPPRYVDPVLGLRPYSAYDARGLALQKTLCRGHYSKDTYWNHASLSEDSKTILLITLQHIFLVEKSRLWGTYEPVWTIRVDDLLTVPTIENNKLLFSVRQEQDMNSYWNEEKSISNDDKLLLHWLKNQIEMVLVIGMEDKPCA